MRDLLGQLLRREALTLVLLMLLAGSLWGFAEIADEVIEQETRAFDRAVLLAMRSDQNAADPVGPPWLEDAVRDITALGSATVVVCATLAVLGFLVLERRWRTALMVLVAVGGGQATSVLLKLGFDRPRPELVAHAAHVYTSSFPSGHTMMATVTYLTLAALLARLVTRVATRIYIMAVAVLGAVVVGLSRIYLGVHWPTDVLAGWAAGAAWALASWLVALWLQRRGRLESPD